MPYKIERHTEAEGWVGATSDGDLWAAVVWAATWWVIRSWALNDEQGEVIRGRVVSAGDM